jgi:hypothetical protein
MGQRVYPVSRNTYSNILGIFTNIRQVRKFITSITDLKEDEKILLHEIRLNEPEKGVRDVTKMLNDHLNKEEIELRVLRQENQQLKQILIDDPEKALIKQEIRKTKKQLKKEAKALAKEDKLKPIYTPKFVQPNLLSHGSNVLKSGWPIPRPRLPQEEIKPVKVVEIKIKQV